MQSVKSKGTRPEKRLCAIIARMGLRGWKKNAQGITGQPDVAFVRKQVAVFIDGCFWHGCPHCRKKLPATNRDYWERKIKRNIELDKLHDRQLRRGGWAVVRVWEHDIANTEQIKVRILRALRSKER